MALFDVGMKVLDKFIPDPEAKAKAQAELLKMQQEGRLAELNADNIEAQELTKRQQADMASDSWMSKNIRPMTLVFILFVYTSFAIMSAFEINVHKPYVELLGQWGMLIMSFYFGGRTLEKIMDMKAKNDK
jgi:uncharacterized membrane protein (DUF106 family)